MKKSIIKIISFILTLVISASVLCGCEIFDAQPDEPESGNYPKWDFYPEGYTAGFPKYVNLSNDCQLEFWWVETYEECLVAIELLKSHGSTFEKNAIFTHDSELFDTKYCFKIALVGTGTERIKFGDDPFDRRAMDVEVSSYAFFESVTIDEINHGDVSDYNPQCIIRMYGEECAAVPNLSFEKIQYEFDETRNQYFIYNSDKNDLYFSVTSFGYKENSERSVLCLEALINSITFVGFEN